MCSNKKQIFDVKVIPPYQFHLISPLTLFTMGQRRETIVYDPSFIEGEQVNLLIKPRNSPSIAGAAVLRVFPSEIAIVDFYILERYRQRGAGRVLIGAIESLAIKRGIRKINTGRSLHSDNREMIGFLERMGFVKLPLEIYYFSQPISNQEKRIHRFSSIDYTRFLPRNNLILPFTRKYFSSVYEMALEEFANHPFYSEILIYQTLLISSERYSHILVEKNRVNGFAIFSATRSNLHLNFIVIRDKLRYFGLPTFLIGAGLTRAYRDKKTTFSYIVYKTEKLFKEIRQIFKKPDFITIKMEKEIL